MTVVQIDVTVNGGGSRAMARVPKWANGDGTVIAGSRVYSRLLKHQRELAQPPIELDFRPTGEAITPTDIVEQRAVAALLASLRTQREPTP